MTAVVKWTFEDYWQGQTQTQTLYFSGAPVDFVVPDTVSVIRATLIGGSGGGEIIDQIPGGGTLIADIPVTPGETLHLRVGNDGSRAINATTAATGAYNGGGAGGNGAGGSHSAGYEGGGATDIRQGGDDLGHRVAVAGGGGGNSGEGLSYRGGVGGGNTAGNGHSAPGYVTGGYGGSQTAGGAHGDGGGTNGDVGVGGNGYNWVLGNGGGGGGGGWYGGGGGGAHTGIPNGTSSSTSGGGGGGGSNGVAPGVTAVLNAKGTFAKYQTAPMIQLEFTEQADRYVMEINPNDGGAITIQKNILMSQTVGPNRVNILQEGTSQAPVITFSGVILTQEQLEAMERWFDRRVFIRMTDDLGRQYFGVFSKWSPRRQRRASNFWYHSYDAEFTISGYMNASGQWVYGRVNNSGLGGDGA